MSTAPLDRPVWHSLTGPQTGLAMRREGVVRIDPEIGPFAAFEEGAGHGLVDFPPPYWLVEVNEVEPPHGLVRSRSARLSQMVAERPVIEPTGEEIVELGDSDGDAMAQLAQATEPGPWAHGTHRYGGYYGLRENGRLVAMAGTRMRPSAGLAEVSGVCTHPEMRGRGLARRLMMRVIADMVARDEIPFLHSYATNEVANGLYRSLGFVERREMVVTVLERA